MTGVTVQDLIAAGCYYFFHSLAHETWTIVRGMLPFKFLTSECAHPHVKAVTHP